MATRDEIQAKYLALHNALGTRKDAKDKELFDRQHAEIWRNCDIELKARKAELEAKETLTEAEKAELAELEFLFPKPVSPARDLATEIDEIKAKIADYDDLKARIEKLEKK